MFNNNYFKILLLSFSLGLLRWFLLDAPYPLISEEKVVLLNPNNSDDGYYIETGWVSTSNEIEQPNNKTQWSVKGNSKQTPGTPVTLEWENGDGIKFLKSSRDANWF